MIPKSRDPSTIMRKTDKSRLGDIIQESLPVFLEVMKNKEKTGRHNVL